MASQILAVLLGLCFISFLPPQHSNSQKRLYRPTAQEATLVGTITFEGKVPPQRRIDMSTDPPCERVNPEGLTEDFVTTGNKLQDVFVYFNAGDPLTQHTFEQPDTLVTLQHKDCQYRPRALGIRVNQLLRVENNDPSNHNTHPTAQLNKEWSQTQAPNSPAIITSFLHPELVTIRDNEHPWEKAYVRVFSHPFFAISDVYGHYEIRGLPPGSYEIVAWHPKAGRQEMAITLAPGELQTIDFAFGRESY
jgi:hypothetical protein